MRKSRFNKLCDGAQSSYSDTDFTRHSADGEENTCASQRSNCQLNTSLSEIAKSPSKHRVPQHNRSNYGKQKCSLISKEMIKRVALALKVPQQEIASDTTPGESDSKQKARNFDTLMRKTKEKLCKPETKHSEKIQMLNSWAKLL